MLFSKYNVVTSFSKKGYKLYGKKFIETFFKNWPKQVDLWVYHEGTILPTTYPIKSINLLEEVTPCIEFLKRHSENQIAKGRQQVSGQRWKHKCIEEGYNFRFDAFKFCRKPFVLQDLVTRVCEDHGLKSKIADKIKLFWVDADVVTFHPITLKLLDKLLPDNVPYSYLGRSNCYSECGFMGYNLTDIEAQILIHGVADLYASDRIFNVREWHDSFIFDHVRNGLKLSGYDIGNAGRGHVFNDSILGQYMDHLKGDRKKAGRSELPSNEDQRNHWKRYR